MIFSGKLSQYAFLCLLVSTPFASAEDSQTEPETAFGAGEQIVSQAPVGFFTPATIPTPSRSIEYLCPEWEPSRMALLGVPLRGTLGGPDVMKFMMEFLECTVPHIEVGILYDRDEAKFLGRFIHEIEKNPELAIRMDRIHFIESRVQSYWIRDHGPLFGRTTDGELAILDSIYRLLDVESVYDPSRLEAFSFAKQRDYSNDLTPQFIANFLRSDFEYESILVRPPLHLHGGDFAVTERGDVFVSEDTITENGGDLEAIGSVFRQYFAAKDIHILSGPIGNSAKHLDLLFKVAAPKVILASRPPPPPVQGDSYNRKLLEQIANRLANNLDYLRRYLPDHKVVELPMPSMLSSRKKERLSALRHEVLNAVCKRLNLDLRLVMNGDPNAHSALALEMLVATGSDIDLQVEADLETASRTFLGVGVDEYIETFVDHTAIYRSYTNSLILTNASLETLILLPRFIPQPGEVKETYEAYEREVETVYRELYPKSELKWIESDMLTSLGGSIHCASIGVPLSKKHKAPRTTEN